MESRKQAPRAKKDSAKAAGKHDAKAAKAVAVEGVAHGTLENQATVLSFRRGRHTQRTNQFLLGISGVDSRAKASQYIGRRVVWTAPGKARKEIHGKISKEHGRNGVVRARFNRGLPGTAIREKVRIME